VKGAAIVAAAGAAVLGVTGVGLALPVMALAGLGGAGVLPASAVAAVPADWLALSVRAAGTCPGLSWAVPAAIAEVESDFGRSKSAGVHSGTNAAGAAGPMQLGIGGAAGDSFAAYGHPVGADPAPNPPDGAEPPSPYDPADAMYAAVRMLCADGAANPATLPQAVYDYNHSTAYVAEVLRLASSYLTPARGAGASGALRFAVGRLGAPYLWGGEGPRGDDCSGLVQAAYAAGGTELPRTAQAQYEAGPHLGPDAQLEPGDLVFFGRGPADITHVGIYVGAGQMIDAPHAGAQVREEPFGWLDYVGATRPAGMR
jgi:cell wall-associated NlpC family hydrolase